MGIPVEIRVAGVGVKYRLQLRPFLNFRLRLFDIKGMKFGC